MSATAVPAKAALLPPLTPNPRRWPPVIWALLFGTFAVRAAGFVYPYLSYRLAALDMTTATVSWILAVFGGGWLLGQILCGWLADRIGRRATLVGAMLLAAVVFPLLGQARTPLTVAAAAAVSGLVYYAPWPIVSAIVADTIADDSGRALISGWRHFAINLGAATTGIAGGALAGPIGIPALFCCNAAVCALFALVIWRVLPPSGPAAPRQRGGHREAFRNVRLWLLWMANLAALVPVAGLFSILPLLMARDGLPASAYGATQAASALAVIGLTPLINPWLSRRARAGAPMVGLMAGSSLVLGAGMGLVGLASTTLGYSVAASLAVPGEIVVFVATTHVLNRLAPADARGLYAGILGSSLAAAVICAPLMAGWALLHGGDHLAAFLTFATGLLGAALCLPLAVLMRRPRPVRPALSAAHHRDQPAGHQA
ncbi:MFS transporter [Streptomyces sp. NPDC005808]|uniref:MFS transporter n=1 Tax=Streptomyces sp. NPDC005808 TaxID=3364734 RepID=UPI0036830D4D